LICISFIALRKYTEAIQIEPENAQGYLKRSSCYYRLNMYPDSLNDANMAVKLDPTNEKGYLRKGIAAFALEEFETARDSFKSGVKIGNNPVFRTWIRKCDAEIEEDSNDVDDEDSGENIMDLGKKETKENNKPKKTETKVKGPPPLEPDDDVKPEPKVTKKDENTKIETKTNQIKTETNTNQIKTEINKPQENINQELLDRISESQKNPPLQSPSSKIKHDWTQTEEKVMIVIYIKNAKKENCKILMHPKELEVNINLGVSEYVLDLDLCDDIIPSESRYTVLSTKIEINLKKARQSRWPTLEASETGPTQWNNVVNDTTTEKKETKRLGQNNKRY